MSSLISGLPLSPNPSPTRGEGSYPATPTLPLSLYVHLPWCVRKCPYCDFNSHALNDAPLPERDYIDALLNDLAQSASTVTTRPLRSIFIGGGTPNLFSAAAIGCLLDGVARHFPLPSDIEITMEANPGAGDEIAQRFVEYRNVGINRLSLGAQSLDDGLLKTLGRIHTAEEARQAIVAALNVFPRVNLDFMFALPGQTMDMLDSVLREVCAFGASHLSFYQLTLEPHTPFHHAPPEHLPDVDTAAAMQEHVEELLANAGYGRYEVSAYAKPGAKCEHNLNYWQFGDYLGIGAGAHGKVSFFDDDGKVIRVERTIKQAHPRRYMETALDTAPKTLTVESRMVAPHEFAFEFMLNALRLKDGVPRTLFPERTGVPLADIAPMVQDAITRGLLEPDDAVFRTTPLGWRFLNDAMQCFLAEGE
ncbi:MAG: radical SAM family heme chaperone HemW [Proteobacteria bacterium]|nr:radical SAM family heme chaperone HemW [Pseudomonadota bacterium]MCL2307718.1 radical SAM family heme chaperone HemW [Pseudomonadota bacterium]